MLRIEQITKPPRTLAELNPKGVAKFGYRVCASCRRPIMKHWVLNFKTQEMATRQYCRRDGTSYSPGMSNGY